MEVPTLLVGIGGIGSSIAQQAYNRIPEAQRRRVVIHLVDTDVSDLKRFEAMGHTRRTTHLGSVHTVEEHLLHYPDMEAWFPRHPVVSPKVTIQGAGQIRAVSRMAFTQLLRDPVKVEGLEHAVNELSKLDIDNNEAFLPRVMLVNSLAGGTGAGCFIQVALFLRQLIKSRFNRAASPLVRGFFVLPDVLTLTRAITNPQEVERIRANAQACLKELEAIVGAVNGETEPLKLEYYTSHQQAQPVTGSPALEYSFLFDYQNSKGLTLDNLGDYIAQVGRCLHAALFSPLAENQYSQEDNQVLNLAGDTVQERGRARYAGAATSLLRYPFGEIVEFLTLKRVAEDISEVWTRPDRDWRRELELFERDVDRGIIRPEPRRSEHYQRFLREMYESQDAPPAFKRIYPQAFRQDERGRPDLDQRSADYWVAAMLDFIEQSIDLPISDNLRLNSTNLRDVNAAYREVSQAEEQIFEALELVEAYIPRHITSLATQLTTRDAEDDIIHQGSGQQRLNYWLFDGRTPRHPLAVRLFLYQVEASLGAQVARLAGETRTLHEAIDRYEKEAYNLPDTTDYQETAVDRVRAAINRPLLQRLISRSLPNFARTYEQESTKQYNRVQRYVVAKLQEEVLRKVHTKIRAFILENEGFFDALQPLRARLLNRANRLHDLHDQQSDDTVQYVLASAASKDALQNELRRASRNDADEVHRVTYEQLYRAFASREASGDVMGAFTDAVTEQLRGEVLAAPNLPKNIGEALEREAQMNGAELEGYVRDRLQMLPRLAAPYLQTRNWASRAPRTLKFYGLHPSARDTLPPSALSSVIGNPREVSGDPAFSEHEVIFYTVTYGFAAEDLAKFTAGTKQGSVQQPDGSYYTAYQNYIGAIGQGGVTPHLDKHWHTSLPDFWTNSHDINRALLRAVALGVLRLDANAWSFDVQTLAEADHPGHLRGLSDRLEHDDDLLNTLIAKVDDELAKATQYDLRDHPGNIDQHSFISGLYDVSGAGVNLLDLVVDYVHGNPQLAKQQRDQDTVALAETLCDEVRRYVYSCLGDPAKAQTETCRVLQRLRDTSVHLGAQSGVDPVLRGAVVDRLESYC
ncbi:MAG: tubulin-like doman-containing protein [Trueperaceae bacterium]|nr:tubulin-like doman-containing protein [Trueperaceae bacterium]